MDVDSRSVVRMMVYHFFAELRNWPSSVVDAMPVSQIRAELILAGGKK